MRNKFAKVILWIIGIIAVLILAAVIAVFAMANHRSDPKNVKTYNTSNPYIVEKTEVSAHRSGGGIAPE